MRQCTVDESVVEAPQAGNGVCADTRSIVEASDVLCRAIYLNELLFLAGEGLADRELANAITTGAGLIDELLRDVNAILLANLDRETEA